MDGLVCETAKALLRFAPQWGGKKVGAGAWERHYFIAVVGSKPVKTRKDHTQTKRDILNFISYFFLLTKLFTSTVFKSQTLCVDLVQIEVPCLQVTI